MRRGEGTTALALVSEPHLCCSVCLPARDWRPGDQVQDQLSDSIRESERVLAIITDSFIADPWCVLQFTLAMKERLLLPVSGLIGEFSVTVVI